MKRKIVLVLVVILLAVAVWITAALHSRQKPVSVTGGKKILYYRNPMNPEITSPVPMKDQMGMDYVPVYVGGETAKPEVPGTIHISPEKQQLIGVRLSEIAKRSLESEIHTVGRVAYNPELYVAQEEYLQALKVRNLPGMEETVNASESKLSLMGMNREQIEQLKKSNKPDETLYLPSGKKTVWVYVTVYESYLGIVKPGVPVEITTLAFPGKTFRGKVSSLNPTLNPDTRSLQARLEVDNPSGELKPGMYADANIHVPLGVKLAVPEEAVMVTGERYLVFLSKGNGYFEPREIKPGVRTNGYYEILAGLKESDKVVTSGNFFVDSESRLKSAVGNPAQ